MGSDAADRWQTAATAGIETVARQLGFTEGPLWTATDRLLVTSLSRRTVYEIRPQGPSVIAQLTGSPSGLAEDSAGRIWVVHANDPRQPSPRREGVGVSVIENGTVRTVVQDGLTAPNDCIVTPDGTSLLFTDPAGEAFARGGPPGAVRSLDLQTLEVTTLVDDCQYPNGLALSGAWLYVAETAAARIIRFTYDGSRLTDRQVFFELRNGHPDGLCVDDDGTIFVATTTGDSVAVVEPSGRLRTEIDLGPGTFPTNLTVGGARRDTLFITAAKGGRVLAITRGSRRHPTRPR
jgi:gluconolactonase